MIVTEPLQIGEVCRRLDVPYQHAKYILERGYLPVGAEAEPGHGHHRKLTIGQATWLAIILKLKVSGVRVPQAALVADFAREAVRAVGQQMSLDANFIPFEGRLGTDRQWFIDFGDMKYIRLVTYAFATKEKVSKLGGWSTLKEPFRMDALAAPSVVFRVDLTRITQMLLA